MSKKLSTAKSKTEEFIENYPALGLVRYEWRWKKDQSQRWQHPKMNIKVQMADPNSMHLQARNIAYEDRSYVCSNRHELRGTRLEYMCAINHYDRILATLYWERGESEKMSKDIFNIIDPGKISYLMWVQVIEWFEPASEQREEETDGILFGPNRKGVEVDVYIFRRPRSRTFQELIDIADREKKERDEAYLHFPKEQSDFPAIHKMLRAGQKLHAFSSGGGLRVVEFPSNGYGEHPNIEEALKILEEDCLAGGRPYEEVYGKLYPHYLTGSSLSTSNLDYWLRKGSTFDCWQEGNEIIFQLSGYSDVKFPEDLTDRVKEELIILEWEDARRGFRYSLEPFRFADDSIGCSMKKISGPKKKDPYHFYITKTGRGQNFWEAIKNAFEAEDVEV